MADRIKKRTRKGKKRKGFGGLSQSNSSITSSECDNSTEFEVEPDLEVEPEVLVQTETVSSKKVEKITNANVDILPKTSGYRIVDLEILCDVIKGLKCPNTGCQGELVLSENMKNKKGLASEMIIECQCMYSSKFYTSQSIDRQSFDVNKRLVYTMRSLGQGYSGIKTFTSLMNMPQPMTENNYEKVINIMSTVVKSVAEETMQDACQEIKDKDNPENDNNTIVDTAVSVDGSWQKRGHSSNNGVVTAISMDNGKVLDTAPLTRYCKVCKLAENFRLSDPAKYDQWKAEHTCPKNHSGSAGAMEVRGAKIMFERSIEKNGLRYTKYFGDGDSKGHTEVKYTYEGVIVEKQECVGHVQKRVGCRLRGLKRKRKEINMAEQITDEPNKKKKKEKDPLSYLTFAVIDKLQNYYGIAVRSHSNDLLGMQKGIRATLLHVASSKDDNNHTQCPTGTSSWCKFNRDIVTGESTYKPGRGLPVGTRKLLLPIYKELSNEELLRKCLHGKTQNQNECFNALIWQRLPKTKFNALTQLELATYDAVAQFNIGRKATIMIYEKMNMIPGIFCVKGCNDLNRLRLYRAGYKGTESAKKKEKNETWTSKTGTG